MRSSTGSSGPRACWDDGGNAPASSPYLCPMTSELDARQTAVAEGFGFFDDWSDRYEHLIELGKELPALAEADKVEEALIRGCQSRVWLHAALDADGKVRFRADADALITRGIVAMLLQVLDGLPPGEVAGADLWFLERIGLQAHLSPTRANGLEAMVRAMKLYGVALQARATP